MNIEEKKITDGILNYIRDTQKQMENIRILDFKEISAGWETELYFFELLYTHRESTKRVKVVIRMYPGDSAERKLENEYFIYSNLSKQNYPIPKIHFKSTNREYVGKPFLIMDWIPGGVLDSRMSTHPEETMKTFCQLFVDLHKLDWKPFIKNQNSDESIIPSIDSHLRFQEERMNKDNLLELEPIMNWLKKERKKITDEHLALGHYDFHSFNILLNETGEPFVIDWPSARVNDFRFDLGWTLVLFCAYSNQKNRDVLFTTYQEIAGKRIERIDFFEVSAILRRLSDILIIFKSKSNGIGLRDDVSEQIKDTIFHVENLNSYLEILSGIRVKKVDELITSIKNNEH